jgi:uncharacterized protein (TIGR03437 family)
MATRHWGRAFVPLSLLLCLLSVPAQARFEIRDSQLHHDGEVFVVRGVVYSSVPIRRAWLDTMTAAGCRYARDFPLITALGANTIRTLAMVPIGDQNFQTLLADNDLYWLAGFPLDRFHDPGRTLSPGTSAGRALRAKILEEFAVYVDAWRENPRLIAFVFGDEVTANYRQKFAGSAADFYSLVREAAALVKQLSPDAPMVTTAVAEQTQIGERAFGSDDLSQPDLAFWSLNQLGVVSLDGVFHQLRQRTAKPLLVSAFGVDAFDQRQQMEDADTQAATARDQSRVIDAARGIGFPVLGGVWAELLDEWWRGSDSPAQHGTNGSPAIPFADGFLNPAWLGLLGVQPSGVQGLDRLRPRDAYFALAEEWGGAAFADATAAAVPSLDEDGITHYAGGGSVVAPGGLVRLRGRALGSRQSVAAAPPLPIELEDVSVCMAEEPMPLFYADPNEIRGQVPWTAPPGKIRTAAVRHGLVSNIVEVEVAPRAPGIFDGGVFPAGHSCPADEANGVAPGTYLEIYGAGLGPVGRQIAGGLALGEVSLTLDQPKVFFGERELPVVFSGLLPKFVGIYQTNAYLPEDATPGTAGLRLVQGEATSNPYPLRVIAGLEQPDFMLTDPEPNAFVLQRGAPAQIAYLRLGGINSFCDSVDFLITGLPAGVIASVPSGLPGQTLPLYVQAEAGAALANEVEVFLVGRSGTRTIRRAFRVSVLPSLGSIRFRVVSGGWLSTVPVARFEVDGRVLYETSGGVGRGFNFLTVDPATGTLGPLRSFDTWGSQEQVAALEDYLRSLPLGVVVLGAIADDGSLLLTDQTRRIIRETLASRTIDSLGYQYSWAIISRKGAAAPIQESLHPSGVVVLDRELTFPMP